MKINPWRVIPWGVYVAAGLFVIGGFIHHAIGWRAFFGGVAWLVGVAIALCLLFAVVMWWIEKAHLWDERHKKPEDTPGRDKML